MKVLIVGGGFGGIKAALELDKQAGISVTLISDKDYFVYYPTIFGAATGGAMRQSFIPLSVILEGTKVKFIEDTITGYDATRKIVTGQKDYSYDRVIFALGVVTSYFGLKGLDTYSYSIKSKAGIEEFRKHLHDELTSTRKLDKQYVVVGAGPTGVELAASLTHYIEHITRSHGIKHSRIRIKLVEAASRVLPRMSENTSQIVHQRLRELGVSVMTGEKVEWQDDDEVFVSGRSLPTKTVIWTSGVSNHPFFDKHSHSFSTSQRKRVVVDNHMMSGPNTYVIGDNADTPYSGLAQTALHDAIYVSKDISRQIQKKPRRKYKAVNPPVVVSVGPRWAVFEWHGIRIKGILAHILRRSADFIGYSDMLPIGLAMTSWRYVNVQEHDCLECQHRS